MDVIRAAQLHHILPPIALGVRRGSVLHKVHAVLHRLRLEAESFMDVQRMLDATHSITADLGAEAEIVRLSVNASAFFPHWLSGGGGDDGDGDTSFSFQMTSDMGAAAATEEDEGLVAPQDSHVSFRGCLYVPGVFHILDGATHTRFSTKVSFGQKSSLCMRVLFGFSITGITEGFSSAAASVIQFPVQRWASALRRWPCVGCPRRGC